MSTETVKIHPWESVGLGIAPFRVVDLIELPSRSILEANPSAYESAMREASLRASQYNVGLGGCSYCGSGLKYNFVIKDSQNKYFVVGSECVKKTKSSTLVAQAIDEGRKLKRQKRELKYKAEREEYLRQKQVRDAEKAILVEEKNRKLEPYLKTLKSSTEWLTDVLFDKGGGFCSSIATDLQTRFKPISDYPPKAYYILRDIYGKKDNNRSNSKAYQSLVDEFDSNVESTDVQIRKLVEEMENLGL